MNNPNYESMKCINFTSATGTGKTKMMSKLINKLPDYYFIITTLSKGQLNSQVQDELQKDCIYDNFTVYGNADYKSNSVLRAKDIIDKMPSDKKCIWLRDEGHIKTNRFEELLSNICYKTINFSATNAYDDIKCNFTSTMMLRTVNQATGTPEDAIEKLLEVKNVHKDIKGYNPCAIFRCVIGDDELYDNIVSLCKKYDLKYIDITEDSYVMSELCEDDNEYDVIINKFKIVEGIDIRRAHVLFMDNQPGNNATTIQAIGRCRRNALLYRNDIDIMSPDNAELLKATRECYVYYNVENMKIDSDEYNELYYAFCNHISCEALKCNTTVYVENGQLSNGLHIIELDGYTGSFDIMMDERTGFNVVSPLTRFYDMAEEPIGIGSNIYMSNGTVKDEDTGKYTVVYGKIRVTDLKRYIQKYPLVCNSDDGNTYIDLCNLRHLCRPLSDYEKYAIKHGFIETQYKISVDIVNRHVENVDFKMENDRESAIIGVDLMQQFKSNDGINWIESKSVTSKIGHYNKLNVFISNRYVNELNVAKNQYFSGKNDFKLDKRCNSMIGFCVEYYSKYLLYGESYLEDYFERYVYNVDYEYDGPIKNYFEWRQNLKIIRACMNKYRIEMGECFGINAMKFCKNMTINLLAKRKYKYFVDLIVELGERTATFVRNALYPDCVPQNNVNPNLSIRHICGLADYITHDTILDVKVLNHIDEKCVRQVLAYHYLSTKRSDLDIKRVIVYDATSDRAVTINIENKD